MQDTLTQKTQRIVRRRLLQARCCLFVESFLVSVVQSAPPVLIGGILVLASGYYLIGRPLVFPTAAALAVLCLLMALVKGLLAVRREAAAVHFLDRRAGLRDHVASALVFLARGALDGPEQAQLRDTVRRIYNLDPVGLIRWPRGRRVALAALFLLVFVGVASLDSARLAALRQAEEVAALPGQAQLEKLVQAMAQQQREGLLPIEGLNEALEALRAELNAEKPDPADAMRALNDLERALAESEEKAASVEDLEEALSEVEDAMAGAQASQAVAEALSEEDLEKARERLEALSESMASGELSESDRSEMAQAFQRGAQQLAQREGAEGFSEDLREASEGLAENRAGQFEAANESMQNRMGQIEAARRLRDARAEVRNQRMAMSEPGGTPQEGNPESGPGAPGQGEEDSLEGRPQAGSGTDPDVLGEKEELRNEYQKILKAQGDVGEGERQSFTTESGVNQTQGRVDAQELHANYAAAAEAVVSREAIPLSRKLHVKKYFQAIRPE